MFILNPIFSRVRSASWMLSKCAAQQPAAAEKKAIGFHTHTSSPGNVLTSATILIFLLHRFVWFSICFLYYHIREMKERGTWTWNNWYHDNGSESFRIRTNISVSVGMVLFYFSVPISSFCIYWLWLSRVCCGWGFGRVS